MHPWSEWSERCVPCMHVCGYKDTSRSQHMRLASLSSALGSASKPWVGSDQTRTQPSAGILHGQALSRICLPRFFPFRVFPIVLLGDKLFPDAYVPCPVCIVPNSMKPIDGAKLPCTVHLSRR